MNRNHWHKYSEITGTSTPKSLAQVLRNHWHKSNRNIQGESGIKISGGQKQRILLARAIYKDPHYIFLDEATSSLDTENENIIHGNLQEVFKNKTVLIIAHRLSTVKNSDNIIVLKNGRVVEQGNHKELINQKNEYYNLIKNQLELDNV